MLTLIKPRIRKNKHHLYFSIYRCSCGVEKEIRDSNVKSGETVSCGCFHRQQAKTQFKTHGMTGSREYRTWSGMIQRCTNPKNTKFKSYGGRGIKVCKRWIKFSNFFKDMGIRPIGMTLDRIDTNGDYKLSNCKWSTIWEQNNNSRHNRKYHKK
jgi:hypothetical protein